MKKTIKFAAVITAALTGAVAMAQFPSAPPGTPVGPNGEAYWFGPGPAPHQVIWNSKSMTLGDRAWFEWDSAFGFIQYQNIQAGGGNTSNFFVQFNAPTYITVRPYVYVDGYFGLSAAVQGWGTTANLDLGFSRFYILHNAPVFVRFFGNNAFLDPFQAIGPYGYNRIDIDYTAFVRPRLQSGLPAANVRTVNFGPLSGSGLCYLDPTFDTNFFAEVDIQRRATVYWNNPAGNYKATGIVAVASI